MYTKELQELRQKIAKSQGQNSYLIFNDGEMEKLLEVKPTTITELSKVKGFPKNGKRVATYGDELVRIFNNNLGVLGTTNVF